MSFSNYVTKTSASSYTSCQAYTYAKKTSASKYCDW